MADLYGDGARGFQDRFDTRRMADRIEARLVRDALSDDDRAFLARMDCFFLATVDAHGHASCSYKGGEPGFVRVIDERTLAFPSYDGNGMYLSLGAIAETGEVGMLFIDFDGQSRMRVGGRASASVDDPLIASWPEAQAVVRVAVREVFPNCPRYIHRRVLAAPSRFVPSAACATPVPSWKRADWAADVVPDGDPARDPSREVLKR
ncbi:MAG TPA: pyridoxamine 5'-phosphate oxidase family protein [Kofleriaceae bacterium]|nr:pyridoxamine 5'-phosphate oxidase family protein [Kofleriaceae bacterium]